MRRFLDRRDAGRFLARELREYAGRDDVVVLALPRGGVPVAFEIVRALHLPLDVFVVRKLGFPGFEEFALGAIASGGVRILNPRMGSVTEAEIEAVAVREEKELERRERVYRGGRPPMDVRGKVAILVDDGLATGSTMRAAIAGLRLLEPSRIIAAVPVAAAEALRAVENEADAVVCPHVPPRFSAVGEWYRDFSQTTDEEVREMLESALGAAAA